MCRVYLKIDIKIKGWKLRNNIRFSIKYFMRHYLHYFFVCKSPATNYPLSGQSTSLPTIQMSSNTLNKGDHTKIVINLYIPTTAPKIHQILYLWHGSIGFYTYIPALCARLHRIKLSSSIFIIMLSEFWRKNGLTTEIRTKTSRIRKFSIRFEGNTTTVGESSLTQQHKHLYQISLKWSFCEL